MEKDFVLSYQIGVLPADPAQFVQDYVTANGILDESNKWFKDAAVIGKNKPLLDSFSKFAHENKEECCFYNMIILQSCYVRTCVEGTMGFSQL